MTTDNMLAALQNKSRNAASAYAKAGKSIVAHNAYGSAAVNGLASGSGTLYYQNDFIDVDACDNVPYFDLSNNLKYAATQVRLKAAQSVDQVAQNPALAAPPFTDTHLGQQSAAGLPAEPVKTDQRTALRRPDRRHHALAHPRWRPRPRHLIQGGDNISRALKADAKVKDTAFALL